MTNSMTINIDMSEVNEAIEKLQKLLKQNEDEPKWRFYNPPENVTVLVRLVNAVDTYKTQYCTGRYTTGSNWTVNGDMISKGFRNDPYFICGWYPIPKMESIGEDFYEKKD